MSVVSHLNVKGKSFKLFNSFLSLVCATTMYSNYVSVDVLNENSAKSSIGDHVFEYKNQEGKFCAYKDGEFIGFLPVSMKLKSKKTLLQTTATITGGKILAAAIAAKAAGGSFGATVAAELGALVGNTLGAAGAGAGAMAGSVVPGSGALAATLGGAGEVAATAAAADAALMAGGTAAVISSVIVPVLIAAGACGIIA